MSTKEFALILSIECLESNRPLHVYNTLSNFKQCIQNTTFDLSNRVSDSSAICDPPLDSLERKYSREGIALYQLSLPSNQQSSRLRSQNGNDNRNRIYQVVAPHRHMNRMWRARPHHGGKAALRIRRPRNMWAVNLLAATCSSEHLSTLS